MACKQSLINSIIVILISGRNLCTTSLKKVVPKSFTVNGTKWILQRCWYPLLNIVNIPGVDMSTPINTSMPIAATPSCSHPKLQPMAQ